MIALVQAVLLANAGVAALVGTRVFPRVLPMVGVAFPAITVQRISVVTQYGHDGAELVEARIQIDSWAKTEAAAAAVAQAVRTACHAYPGDPDAIQDFKADGDRDYYEADTKLYRVSSDYFAYARDAAA